jgi:hypothetical protein
VSETHRVLPPASTVDDIGRDAYVQVQILDRRRHSARLVRGCSDSSLCYVKKKTFKNMRRSRYRLLVKRVFILIVFKTYSIIRRDSSGVSKVLSWTERHRKDTEEISLRTSHKDVFAEHVGRNLHNVYGCDSIKISLRNKIFPPRPKDRR